MRPPVFLTKVPSGHAVPPLFTAHSHSGNRRPTVSSVLWDNQGTGIRMRPFRLIIFAVVAFFVPLAAAAAPRTTKPVCDRPAPGSEVPEPEDLRSQNGTLKVELTFHNFVEADGEVGYCYLYKDGAEAPTLRLKPGDWLVLSLKNELTNLPLPKSTVVMPKMSLSMSGPASCGGGSPMGSTATNLHFHGLTVPAICHEDDVLQTAINPSNQAFEYKFQIPPDEPPGLYWYHPHIHGSTKLQVLGGASGALIIEGLERAEHDVAGLPERVLMIRDQDLVNPNAQPIDAPPAAPPVRIDPDGDAMNSDSGTGKPAKDMTLNFVPVSFPEYKPAIIRMKPLEKQFWRVVNASAITYVNLQLTYDGLPQQLEIVGMDGVPLNQNHLGGAGVIWENHVGLPPGGRAEFIVTGPAQNSKAVFLTRSVNTGAAGENDPIRPLATLIATPDASEPRDKLSTDATPLPTPAFSWLGDATPVRTRKFYFSEVQSDPKDPNSPTQFFLTLEGQKPKLFDPSSPEPNIVAHEGDVEDWIIENRSQELHAFHIHQVHFVLKEWFGVQISEPFLRDTINIPFWDGKSPFYPFIRIRVDFRDPNSVGTFVYHCHLLEHEDGGMMGTIHVEPRQPSPAESHDATKSAAEKRSSTLVLPSKKHVLCGESASASSKNGF
jgi:FtsP/CotA-like multicopper oxidase with cupredoxin domain